MYEIQGPRYLNSDVTVHFDSVEVEQAGPDRVRIQPVLGSPPPPTTKVAIFAKVGYQVVQTIFVTAPRVEEKIALLRRQLDELLDDGIDRLEVTQLGAAADNPSSQWAATVTVRVMGTASTPEPLSRSKFPEALDSLYCSSIPGYFLDGGAQRVTKPWARVDYWPALLPATALSHRAVLDDGSALHIDAPATTQPRSSRRIPNPLPAQSRSTTGVSSWAPSRMPVAATKAETAILACGCRIRQRGIGCAQPSRRRSSDSSYLRRRNSTSFGTSSHT